MSASVCITPREASYAERIAELEQLVVRLEAALADAEDFEALSRVLVEVLDSAVPEIHFEGPTAQVERIRHVLCELRLALALSNMEGGSR